MTWEKFCCRATVQKGLSSVLIVLGIEHQPPMGLLLTASTTEPQGTFGGRRVLPFHHLKSVHRAWENCDTHSVVPLFHWPSWQQRGAFASLSWQRRVLLLVLPIFNNIHYQYLICICFASCLGSAEITQTNPELA